LDLEDRRTGIQWFKRKERGPADFFLVFREKRGGGRTSIKRKSSLTKSFELACTDLLETEECATKVKRLGFRKKV